MATNNQQFLSYTKQANTAKPFADINTPFSFKDWLNRHPNIQSGQEYQNYNQYLIGWFTKKQGVRENYNTQLRLDYLNLLRQLQLFLSTEEKQNWYNNIDLNSEKEILLAIPFFAKKLKEIAIYYLKVREDIKKTKIKYNLVGTNTGIIQQLQEQLLNSFTKKPNSYTTIPATIWSGIPNLSSVKDNLTIEIEELYDDHQYFDQDPSQPVTTYYSLTANKQTKDYFTQKGYELSAVDWIYKTGNFATQIDALVGQLTATQEDFNQIINYANGILTKYLGTEKYISSLPEILNQTDTYNINIVEGNNFFYWPYGPYEQNIDTITRYQALPISAANLEFTATPGLNIDTADTIFVKTAKEMRGAWLRLIPSEQTSNNINVLIDGNTKTIFKYPFPGYGLSAENTNWSGPQISYTPEFKYLDSTLKKSIEQEYWSFNQNISSVEPIKINDATLIEAGSYASTQYDLADKIRQLKNPPPLSASAYNGSVTESWLYKMLKTDIPIASTPQSNVDNVILWPYGRIDTSESFPTYIPKTINTVCEPVYLSAMDLPFATASTNINTADVVYKISNYKDTERNATEAAWLYTSKQVYELTNKPLQDSLSLLLYPGTFTQFVWEGPNLTDIEDVFKSFLHQPDCTFLNTVSASPDQHTLCNCGQTIFTPFGHPGELFIDNNGYADFIAEDTLFEESFDLNTWRDSADQPYNRSTNFAWYQTKNNKTGWGYGNWKIGTGNTTDKFLFRTGKRYIYYRSNTRLQDPAISPFPLLTIRHSYNTKKTVWKKAIKNTRDTWVQTTQNSNMILYPGDLLLYKKVPVQEQINYSKTVIPVVTATNKNNSLWSNYTFVSLYTNEGQDVPSIRYTYPKSFTIAPRSINLSVTTPPPILIAREPVKPTTDYNLLISNIPVPVFLNVDSSDRVAYQNAQNAYRAAQAQYRAEVQAVNALRTQEFNSYSQQLKQYRADQNEYRGQLRTYENYKNIIERTPIPLATQVLAVSCWLLTTPATGYNLINYPATALSALPVYIPTGNITRQIDYTDNFSFIPTEPGVYKVQAVVVTSANIQNAYLQSVMRQSGLSTTVPILTGLYYINNIPSLTASFLTTTLTAVSTINIPSPGFVINESLYGWNYNNNTPAPNALGARPFWAVTFSDKNQITKSRSVPNWGAPTRLVDGHNIITQPIISDSLLETGDYIEYSRRYPTPFVWQQPAVFNVQTNKIVWSTIAVDTSGNSNLSSILNNLKYSLVTNATNLPSNLSISNVVDNNLVEVHYNAIRPFAWNIQVRPEIVESTLNKNLTSSLILTPDRPWNSIPNRYFPTLAFYPTLENLYSKKTAGGFFTPQNLGASLYLNKNFTTYLNPSSSSLLSLFNNGTNYPAGRGLTKQEQPTPYFNTLDNNSWLKEPIISGVLAGTIKKSISKQYQKFIPYQSEIDTNPNKQTGLILPTSRQTPWGGENNTTWTDLRTKPVSFTGVPNVSAWSNAQLLKNTNKLLDCWSTDIFGNQYGLYKNIANIDPYNRKFIGGELWVRKNSQYVSPASQSLSGVFDTYNNTSLQNELLFEGIRKIDIFFDTLYIETSGTVIFEKINYDYDTDKIYSITDNTRYLSLAIPVSASLQKEITNTELSGYSFAKAGDTWFSPQEKIVYISVCGLQNNILIPEIYKLDLISRDFVKVFPNNNEITTINEISALQLQTIDPPTLTYCTSKKQFVLSILGNNSEGKNTLVEFYIKNAFSPLLKEIVIYEPKETLYSNLPSHVSTNLFVNTVSGSTSTYQITATNNPISFKLVNDYSWVTLDNTGLFTYTPQITGITYIPFSVSNSIGPIYYTLTLNITS